MENIHQKIYLTYLVHKMVTDIKILYILIIILSISIIWSNYNVRKLTSIVKKLMNEIVKLKNKYNETFHKSI